MAVAGTDNGDRVVNGNVICTKAVRTQADTGKALLTDVPQKATYTQARGTAIVADTGKDLVIVGGATGTSYRLSAAITGLIATGADRTVDVDVQRSTAGGAFATILSAPIHFTNADTLRTAKTAVPNTTGLVAGDILQAVVTVAGAAGNQAQGLVATLDWTEAP